MCRNSKVPNKTDVIDRKTTAGWCHYSLPGPRERPFTFLMR